MTMHETLNFLDALTKHLEHSIGAHDSRLPGGPRSLPPWSRPTRELVTANLRLNRAHFPRDRRVYDSFNRQFKIALDRHWIAQGPCQAHCHATHVWLTVAGQDVLKLMNEQGCGPQCAQHKDLTQHLHLQRKVA